MPDVELQIVHDGGDLSDLLATIVCRSAAEEADQVDVYCTHELGAEFSIGGHLAFYRHEMAKYMLSQEAEVGNNVMGLV